MLNGDTQDMNDKKNKKKENMTKEENYAKKYMTTNPPVISYIIEDYTTSWPVLWIPKERNENGNLMNFVLC